jgi:hypothetical protein
MTNREYDETLNRVLHQSFNESLNTSNNSKTEDNKYILSSKFKLPIMINNHIYKNFIKDFIKCKKVNLKKLKSSYEEIKKKAIISECNICCETNTDLFLFCCNNTICTNCDDKIKSTKYICPFCRKKKYKLGIMD